MNPIDPISISFCISDNYAQHLAVVVASILEHNPNRAFRFHVLFSALSESNRSKLTAWEKQLNGCGSFVLHPVERKQFDAFPLPLEHITQEMYYRYLLPDLLTDETRTIYMDVDVLVLGDLSPLWTIDLQGCLLAGTTDVKENTPDFQAYKMRLGMKPDAKYFYSGMLVMDLVGLRACQFGKRCMENTALHYKHIAWPDQDVINLTMEGKILELPMRFNCTIPRLLPKGETLVIRHFANFSAKPWCCLPKNRTWLAYLHYLLKTPYRGRAWAFIGMHLRGFFWFSYVKKGIKRNLVFGVLVYKKRIHGEE